MTETALWQAVLGDLEVTTSKAHFQTWLKRTNLFQIDHNTAIITVPDIFVRSWMESHYKDRFLQSFQKQGTQVAEVQFQIEGSAPTDAPKQAVAVVERVNDSDEITPPTPQDSGPKLDRTIIPHHTFDTFVVGNNSRLAYNVGLAVAKNPGTLHNPLFIYGGVGLGKTHLMHAIGNEVMANNPKARVRYVSCETFTNDYISAISSKRMDQFKKSYRTVDVLIVDDVQFISNKEGSQEEFFNTFNTLHQSNRQIVIAADRPPKAIPGLEERLSSRLGWGMIADIQSPNLETRTAILKSKCEERHIDVPNDALEYIATQVQSNIRELEGALTRVITYCQMMQMPFSVESTRAALSGLIVPAHKKSHSPDTLLRTVSEYFGVPMDQLISQKRTKDLVYPRQMTMYLFRSILGMSHPNIGREMGGKDHTTIMHGVKKIEAEQLTNPQIRHDITALTDKINSY